MLTTIVVAFSNAARKSFARLRKTRYCVAVIAASAVLSPAVHAQLGVSDGGTPSYSQAIAVPPGVAGMSPKIGLFYAGGGVNGPVGHGWSVQGISTVTRCPATRATDGKAVGVLYGVGDKLCLDGQRLIQTDESGNPAAAQNASGIAVATQVNDSAGLGGGYREFRTEKDTYARVRSYGYANGDTTGASGPAYFKVWTKSGQVYEYGASPSADANTRALVNAKPLINGQAATVPMAWAVARISDTLGNFIDFKYEQRDVAWGSGPTSTSPTLGHEWNLLEIQYSTNKVVFNYVDRTSITTGPQDSAEAYHQGSKNVSVRLLQNITTYVNSPNATSLGAATGAVAVKTTKLTYNQGPITGRSRVTKIQECAGDVSSTRCLPATAFNYASGGNEAYQSVGSFASSGLATLDMQNVNGASGVLLGDFDGDGKTDIIYWHNAASQNKLYKSNGDGTFQSVAAFSITTQNLFMSDQCYYSIVADFNGDGISDILRVMRATSKTNTSCGTRNNLLFLGSATGAFTQVTVPSSIDTTQKATVRLYESDIGLGFTQYEGRNFFLIDVNGDGVLDIITTVLPEFIHSQNPPSEATLCASITCTHVYIGSANGTFTEQTNTNLTHRSVYSDPPTPGGYAPVRMVDVNGDGFADLLADNGTWLSLGDANFSGPPPTTGFSNSTNSGWSCGMPMDFNGDGRRDCLRANQTASSQTLQVSDGSQTLKAVAGFNLVAAGNEMLGTGIGIQVADVNGDGREDIIRWEDDPTKNVVYLSRGDGTFSQSSTFNLGGGSAVQLQKSDGSTGFVVGDFSGRGSAQILRLQNLNGAVVNRLYTKVDPTPADQLISVTTGTGATTTLYYVPLTNATPSNGVSGNYGARYVSDRGTANAAGLNTLDVSFPMYVVATSASDSGVGSTTVNTEYSYAGLKADTTGRGLLGFREVRRQSPGPNGNPLTVDTQYLGIHPYIGVASRTDTYNGALDATSAANLLSSTLNTYCDKTAATGAEATALTSATTAAAAPTPQAGASCPTLAKVQRPYLLWSKETGTDLSGAALPSVITQNTFNAGGDPTNILVTTNGSVAGISQPFSKSTTNTYQPDSTACSDAQTCNWILGRLTQAQVTSSVPNSLGQISTSAGGGPNAIATSGSGPMQSAVITPSRAFGNVNVGSASSLSATLANDGAAALSINTASASVAGTDFALQSTTCGTTLAPGSSCTWTVSFTPTANTTRTGTLSVSTGAGTMSSSLSGTGLQGTGTPSPTSLSFPSTQQGQVSASQTLTLTNTGNRVLAVSSVAVGAHFGVTSNTCSSIAINGTCQVGVRFAPTASGSLSGALTITHDGSGGSTSVGLSGTALLPAGTLSAVGFGNVAMGASSTLISTLTNTGVGPLTLTVPNAASVSGTDFAFVSTNCVSPLAVSGSCTISLSITPTAIVARSGSLSVVTGAGTLTAALSGTGTGSIATRTSAAALTVPAVWYGAAAQSVTATYRNDGNTAMTLNTPTLSAPLSVTSNSCSAIAAGASCNIVVTAATNVAGIGQSQSFTPTGATTAPAASIVTWTTQTAVPRWSSTSLSFGNVTVNTSASQNITLTNDGNTTYNWASNSAIANAPAGYAFNTSACTSVAPGGSCTVAVTFTPTAIGTTYAGGSISMSAASYNTNTFAVSGTGAGSIATLTSAASQTFTSTPQGGTAPTLSWTLRNDGNANMTLLAGALNSPFSWTSNTCTNIAPGTSCALYAQLATSAIGSFSQGGIAVSGANQGNRSDLSMSGTIVSTLGTFSYVSGLHDNRGMYGDHAVATIKNVGTGTITAITFICTIGPFVPASGPTSLAPGASGTYVCTATAAGGYTAILKLTGSNATNSPYTTPAF